MMEEARPRIHGVNQQPVTSHRQTLQQPVTSHRQTLSHHVVHLAIRTHNVSGERQRLHRQL
jgi:hypothetical protein